MVRSPESWAGYSAVSGLISPLRSGDDFLTLSRPDASVLPRFSAASPMYINSLRLFRSCFFCTTGAAWISAVCLSALLVACGTAPVQEMSEARQAIEAARAAGARDYAAEEYDRAESLLKNAEHMLNNRNYNKARESANEARDEAIRAREVAQQAKPQATPLK
jgi:hypothetical protein